MSATIIDGKAIAAALREEIKSGVDNLKSKKGFTPGLAVVLVGENPASQVYVGNKVRQTKEVGMNSFEYRLPASTTELELLSLIAELNADNRIHGILVQLPLPNHISDKKIIEAIAPEKDVDGFSSENIGKLCIGMPAFVPCTPQGCLHLIKSFQPNLSSKQAVIIGRSNIVGKPMAMLLLHENCTITIAHSKTENLPELCKNSDIIVAAIGKPEFVQGSWLKKGSIIIDVGINRVNDKLVGDVHFESASEVAGAITPVPGGVGPMTIACLLRNTLFAASAVS